MNKYLFQKKVMDEGWVSCEVMSIYSHVKSRGMSDVKLSIGSEKAAK